MFTALGAAGIPIHNITTSEIKISCILGKEHAQRALGIAHEAFGLDRLGASVGTSVGASAAGAQPALAGAVIGGTAASATTIA
jgi:aspartate kinase